MKERLVRGELLVPIVRMVKSQRRHGDLPELGSWEKDLLARRIAPTTWYALEMFDSLLQTAHRFVLDGSEAAARRIGVGFAANDLASESAKRRKLGAGELHGAEAELTAFAQRWRELFNFGACEVSPCQDELGRYALRTRITGYPDMSATLGHATSGYVEQLASWAGSTVHEVRMEERPWMHNNVLTLLMICELRGGSAL